MAKKDNKTVDAYQHHEAKRTHIPSKEEAGTETANPLVNQKQVKEIPKNPIIDRATDPQLFWLNKNGNDDREELLKIDIRSLYRYEHVSPETIMQRLYRNQEVRSPQMSLLFETFGNDPNMDELDKVSEYYKHQDGWTNRLIQGDSLRVMTSLLEREGMAAKVQTIYIDPPYGIKYGSNWQNKLNNRDVKDGSDDHITNDPEQIKAFRDTWEYGIHSYLSYLRDRLLIASELLTESGSCFVQISDENVHLVRNIMDEVFGSENFVSLINFATSSGFTSSTLSRAGDYLIWYAKQKENIKYRKLFLENDTPKNDPNFKYIELKNKERRAMTNEERQNPLLIPRDAKIYRLGDATSQGKSSQDEKFEFEGQIFEPKNRHWTHSVIGMQKLAEKNLVVKTGNTLALIRYFENYRLRQLTDMWTDTGTGGFTEDKDYVVQTNIKVIERCILMTTDPGDLVLDPTCGSGTTAAVAEQWGRRWITIDTSRIALNIAKIRLMTATFPYYHLYSDVTVERTEAQGKIIKKITPKPAAECVADVRQGFVYEEVPHITLKSLANDEPADTETLYDRPFEDKRKLRVSGAFTVETLQSYEPTPPEALDQPAESSQESEENFERKIFEHLKSAGVINGDKNEKAVFVRVERMAGGYLHAEGFYQTERGESKAYIHIGPKYGAVSKQAYNGAVKECRNMGDADWLILMGFAFESDLENKNVSSSYGGFQVSKVRMHDDLLQEGLTKKDKKAGSFITIGEPDIALLPEGNNVVVEVRGMDIYDPLKDEVKARSVADIAYWMVDDDYDGSSFIVKQVFFCGGDKDEFAKWKKGLSDLTKQTTRKNVERTLKIEIDEEAFERLYGYKSHSIEAQKGKKIAVRVVSHFGEESTKVFILK
ncbi:site-specific DNA-methyltransferase [Runella zeae]|uniref:site-specific DNA-methyltransferase n=1 Tax=Runella zeae TaxID=94255 RepID=UPI0003F9FB8E|nr:site-specific DNA-methyltransferase [Runella zeae]